MEEKDHTYTSPRKDKDYLCLAARKGDIGGIREYNSNHQEKIALDIDAHGFHDNYQSALECALEEDNEISIQYLMSLGAKPSLLLKEKTSVDSTLFYTDLVEEYASVMLDVASNLGEIETPLGHIERRESSLSNFVSYIVKCLDRYDVDEVDSLSCSYLEDLAYNIDGFLSECRSMLEYMARQDTRYND